MVRPGMLAPGPSGSSLLLHSGDASASDEQVEMFVPSPTAEALQFSRQLLSELGAVYRAAHPEDEEDLMSAADSSFTPPSPPPVAVREIEWTPIISSIVTFAAILLATLVAKKLVLDESTDSRGGSAWYRGLSMCFSERKQENAKLAKETDRSSSASSKEMPESTWVVGGRLLFCVTGILSTYVWYGVLQEQVMTHNYAGEGDDGSSGLFNQTNFLVASSRLVALLLCAVLLVAQHWCFPATKVPHTVPLYKYSFGSFTNNMSTQAQYEMLKYLSFPLQVLGKSCKVPPVMVFEFVLSRRVYTYVEYSLGVIIVGGAVVFQAFSRYQPDGSVIDNLPGQYKALGVALLAVYIVADSFTSNWQHKLFVDYSVDWLTMSFWSNFFSLILATVGTLAGGEIGEVASLLEQDTSLRSTIWWLALSSAIGNCFIFYTIKHFGPVTYAAIATIRQLLSIIISIKAFNHIINAMQIFGIILVFAAIFAPLYPKLQRDAAKRQRARERARLEEEGATKPALCTMAQEQSSWFSGWCALCVSTPKQAPLLPSSAADGGEGGEGAAERKICSPCSCFFSAAALYAKNRYVRIGLMVTILASVQVAKAIMTKTIFVQLHVPIFFSFSSGLITLVIVTLVMGLFPNEFSYPTKADLPLIGFCSILVACDIAAAYGAIQLLPLGLFAAIRSLELITASLSESLYLRVVPGWISILLIVGLAGSTILFTYQPYTAGVSGLGVFFAVASIFISGLKQVTLRVAQRHMHARLSGLAFIYWIEFAAVLILLIWSGANGDLTRFADEQDNLTPVQLLSVTLAGIMGGARLIFEVMLLRHASATTSAVAEIFAYALICLISFCSWGPEADTEIFGVGDLRTFDHGQTQLLGMNIAGLSLTVILLAIYVFYHMQHPAAYGKYPPIEGEELEAQPAKAKPPAKPLAKGGKGMKGGKPSPQAGGADPRDVKVM